MLVRPSHGYSKLSRAIVISPEEKKKGRVKKWGETSPTVHTSSIPPPPAPPCTGEKAKSVK